MTRKVTPAPKSGITKTTRAKKTVSPKESTINLKQDLLSQIKIDLKHKNENNSFSTPNNSATTTITRIVIIIREIITIDKITVMMDLPAEIFWNSF
jgi:CRISPR/Cas system endoribonuclease Cas6 (RAMP superfamily)